MHFIKSVLLLFILYLYLWYHYHIYSVTFLFVCHRNLNPARKEKPLKNHVQLLLRCKVLSSVRTIRDSLCRHSHSHSFILCVGIHLCRLVYTTFVPPPPWINLFLTIFISVNGDAGDDEANTMFGEASKFHKTGKLHIVPSQRLQC